MSDAPSTSGRLPVTKTYKLAIGGKFPRSESGRSVAIETSSGITHVCRASRKDLRGSVEAAQSAQPKWAGATAYLRGQVLYRLAEMTEGKRLELADAIGTPDAHQEVDAAIDRLVVYAGWTDKYAQLLGSANPVAGPYHNFSLPEPSGVVGVVCPDESPLLGFVSLIAPAICSGNAVIALASESNPVPACVFAEAIATSDLPGGVINTLTGFRDELVPHFASHRGIDGLHAANIGDEHSAALEQGVAENMKRAVIRRDVDFASRACDELWWIEPFVETKTIWHPSGA